MANVKLELNDKGFRELLKSEPVRAAVEKAAKGVLDKCPDIGYGMTMGETEQRARAFFGTRSVYSIRHNNKHETLRRAIG